MREQDDCDLNSRNEGVFIKSALLRLMSLALEMKTDGEEVGLFLIQLIQIVKKCLEANVENRPSAAELLTMLENCKY